MAESRYSFEDVKNLYKEVERTKGIEAYKYIDEVFEKARGATIKRIF